jgi:uridine kinase
LLSFALFQMSEVSCRVLLIGAGSASGKTKFGRELADRAKEVTMISISLDRAYRTPSQKAFADIKSYNFDTPEAFDWPLLVQTTRILINKVKQAKVGDELEYELPVYNFKTHKRAEMFEQFSITMDKPRVAIVLEGIFALHNKDLLEMADIKIFIDANKETRLFRRVIRDVLFRERDILSIVLQTLKFVEPAYERMVVPTKQHATITVNNNISVEEVENVMQKLKEAGCENFTPTEMKRVFADKEETFVTGIGKSFNESIEFIAAFISGA